MSSERRPVISPMYGMPASVISTPRTTSRRSARFARRWAIDASVRNSAVSSVRSSSCCSACSFLMPLVGDIGERQIELLDRLELDDEVDVVVGRPRPLERHFRRCCRRLIAHDQAASLLRCADGSARRQASPAALGATVRAQPWAPQAAAGRQEQSGKNRGMTHRPMSSAASRAASRLQLISVFGCAFLTP